MRTWLAALVRRRGGRLLSAALGVAVALALLATLGAFLATLILVSRLLVGG